MKTKFLSLLLVLCIVVGCTGITAFASTDAKISLTEDFGEVSILLTGANTYGGELIVGFYDQYDKACMVKNYKAYDDMTYTLTAPGDAERVKVMWVKSFKSLKPVCPPAEKAITKATVTEIDVTLIDSYSDISNGYIEYYETPESIKTTKIYVSDNAPVYVNGMLYSYGFSSALSVSSYRDATVKFIENTQDKYCDIIEFTIYDYYCVEEVNVASDRIVFGGVSGKSVTFTDFLEDPSYTIAFKDKDGKDIEIADFKAGDVVGVVAADVGKCKPSPTNNVVTYYNLGENSVTGMITALNTSKNTVWINEKEYDVIGKTVGMSSGFKLGDEGKYLLTKTGKIFDCYEIQYDVAYILNAHYDNSGIDTGTLQFQILTDDNEIVIVDAAPRFTYYTSNGTGETNVNVETSGYTIGNIYKASGSATTADRLVKYKLNSSNELRSIEAFSIYYTAQVSNARWNANINTLGGNELTDNAKIFAIDSVDATNSYVTSISAFKEDGSYTGLLADFNEDSLTYSASVIIDGFEVEEESNISNIDKAQGIAIVANIATTTFEGEEATMVTVYKDNDHMADILYFTGNHSYNDGNLFIYNETINGTATKKLNVGSVLLYTAGENGLVSDCIVLATYDVANKVLTPDTDAIVAANGTTPAGLTYGYDYGFIDTIRDGKVTIKNTGVTYKAGGNMYTFEYRAKAPVITVDDYTAGDVDIYDYETNKANFVFIKLENSRVTDIYTISNRANYTSSIITQSTDLK